MAKEKISTRKKVGCSIGIVVAALLSIFVFCGRYFKSALKGVANFFVGTFGMAFYGMMIAVIVICSFLLAGKRIRVPRKYVVHFCLMAVEIIMLVHMFSTYFILTGDTTFSQYASYVYNYYAALPTFGGILFGIVVYAFVKVITIYATAIIFFGLLVWSVVMIGDFFYSYFTGKLNLTEAKVASDILPTVSASNEAAPEDDARAKAYKILFEENSINTEEVNPAETAASKRAGRRVSREEAEDLLFNPQQDYYVQPNDELGVKGYRSTTYETPKTPVAEDNEWRISQQPQAEPTPEVQSQPEPVQPAPVIQPEPQPAPAPVVSPQPQPQPTPVQPEPIVQPMYEPEPQTVDMEQVEEPDDWRTTADDDVDMADVMVDDDYSVQDEPSFQPESEPEDDDEELVAIAKETPVEGGIQMGFDFRTKEDIRKAEAKVHKYPKYVCPPMDLLDDAVIKEDLDEQYRRDSVNAIINKLSIFGIKVESVGEVVGPSVTRYMFRVTSPKTRMSDFATYSSDLKACLEARGEIRIEAPIPGTNLVGIEVANKNRSIVPLRTVMESKAFTEHRGKLVFVVGQQISGEMVVEDLAKLPHLLVAGTTGSGKSVFLHSLIASLMYRYGPEYLRFIMVDPKLVEFGRYNGVPHMLTQETITNAGDALAAMDYLVNEMETRYLLLQKEGVSNIADYNKKINPKLTQRLPYLVLVVDELADLMSISQKSFEQKLQRLAQKARAAGIHLVLATQRPDTKVISGTIKTNFPCRVALKVASYTDSGTILNGGGAEKLLGYGDLLYMEPSSSELRRIQGTYLTNEEIESLVTFLKSQNDTYYDAKVADEIFVSKRQEVEEEAPQESESKEAKLDPYCKKALRFWLEKQGGRASIASIQRSLGIGFNRAGRIMAMLQDMHYVEQLAPSDPSSKPLKVLVSLDELDTLFPDMLD